MTTTTTNHTMYKETGKNGPFTEKKKLTKTIPEEAQTLNL